MTRILEQCNGTIKDGLCMKCFNRTATSSSICTQMYEVEDKKAPVGETDVYTVNRTHEGGESITTIYKNGELVKQTDEPINSLSLGMIAATERNNIRNEAIQECQKLVKDHLGSENFTAGIIVSQIEKLKKS